MPRPGLPDSIRTEIIRLALMGHTDETVAESLSLSVAQVRYYRITLVGKRKVGRRKAPQYEEPLEIRKERASLLNECKELVSLLEC